MPEFPLLPEVSAPVREDVDRYCDQFVAAKPFRHVMIESFFEPEFAEELLTEFPDLERDDLLACLQYAATAVKLKTLRVPSAA